MNDQPGVRISLDTIYQEVRGLHADVKSVKQTVEEVLKPELNDLRTRTASLELRVYAILAGLIAAYGAGKGLGLL